jgi:sec-independent protein translocase protein TatA
MFGIGTSELLIIMVIALLVFGAKRLPEIGNSLGKGIRQFRRSLNEIERSVESLEPPPRPPAASEPDEPPKLSE